MTRPLPVTAYAAVSPDGQIDCDVMGRSEETARAVANEWYEVEIPLSFIPVTIIPQEQYEAMVEAMEEAKDFINSVKADAEYECDEFEASEALNKIGTALAALKEQDHG